MRMHTTTTFSGWGLLPGAILSLCLIGLSSADAQAQRQQRFKAGILAGVTAAQIDGDASAGYNKVGLQAGLRGIVLLKPKQDASIELLFSQRGSRNEAKTPPYFKTTLQFIEVPLQWHYHDWPANGDADDPDYFRIHFNTGLAYGRLINYKNDSDVGGGITAALPDLNRNSVCFLIGASYFATKHLGFVFRYHRALNALYKPGKPGTNYDRRLKEHYLAFQTLVVF